VTRSDVIGLVLSYAYAFGMLTAVETVGRRLGWRMEVTRKIIHIGAGMWVWGMLALFDHWWAGVIPFATFIALNWLFSRRQTFQTMDDERSSPGTVYFAISITVLYTMLWRTSGVDRAPVATAAVMAMTWGDAIASLVGQRWGRRHYRFFGHRRSLEGSAAMALACAAAVLTTLLWLPASPLSPGSLQLSVGAALVLTAVCTATAVVAEAVSPAGTDNLTVPLLSAAAMLVALGWC
jgi:dolichol kinase